MVDLPLRDYQIAALAASKAALERGVDRQLVSMPTGSGKTFLAAHLRKQYRPSHTIILAHRDELVAQARKAILQVTPDVPIGIVEGHRNELHYEVTVASVQTVTQEDRLKQLLGSVQRPLLVIHDESHHATATTHRRVIDALQADLLFGMTATAYRADKVALGTVFQEIVYHMGLLPLILSGQLAMPIGIQVKTDIDLDTVHTRAGELVEGELAHAVNVAERNQMVVDAWKENCFDKGRKRCIVFAVDTQHAENLRDMFRGNGTACEMVLGKTPISERQILYQVFAEGKLPVLVNVAVLTEGFDSPLIDSIILARPTKSLGLFTQMIGRGLRAMPGKETVAIIDMVDNTSRHRLASMATLAGHEAAERAGLDADSIDDEAPIDLGQGELPLDFVALVNRWGKKRKLRTVEVDLFSGATRRWAPASHGKWMTCVEPGVYVALWPQGDDGYIPVRVTKLDRFSRAEGERLFDRPLDVSTARALAEALVPESPLTSRRARWLTDPATEKQIGWARSQGISAPDTWTKGDAASARDSWEFERIIAELRQS